MILTWVLAGVSVLAFILVMLAPVTSTAYDVTRPVSEQYKEIFSRNGLIILLTILLNIYGTLTLVGGAIYSAYLFWRKKILVNRMFGNILIAVGCTLSGDGWTPCEGRSHRHALPERTDRRDPDVHRVSDGDLGRSGNSSVEAHS